MVKRNIGLIVIALMVGFSYGIGNADEVQSTMQDWLTTTKNQGAIPAGTKITMQNWQQYKQFMPEGMVALFEGKYF